MRLIRARHRAGRMIRVPRPAWTAAFVAALAAAGCSEGPVGPEVVARGGGQVVSVPTNTGLHARPPGLRGGLASAHEVAVAALEGLASRSRGRLERLRLTKYEHNVLVWPELPASRPEVNFPLDFAWRNIEVRNQSARERLLAVYGGRDLLFERVECLGETERFASFKVHTDCWVSFFVDGPTLHRKQLFKHLLEWEGQYKIFRYYEP